MDTVKIIGIKRTPSSKDPNRLYHNYYYTCKHSDYDMEHAADISGMACGVEFSMADIGCKVGDEVEFKYTKGFQDKATLVGCTIIHPAPENIGKK
jgi:plastocyanin